MISKGDIKATDEKSQTDSKVLDDINNFFKIVLRQVIWTHCGIFMTSTPYQCNEKHVWSIVKKYRK